MPAASAPSPAGQPICSRGAGPTLHQRKSRLILLPSNHQLVINTDAFTNAMTKLIWAHDMITTACPMGWGGARWGGARWGGVGLDRVGPDVRPGPARCGMGNRLRHVALQVAAPLLSFIKVYGFFAAQANNIRPGSV